MGDVKCDEKFLAEEWKKLLASLKRNKKFEFDMFEHAFSKTYLLLSQKATDKTIDKKYIDLIVEASLFANGDIDCLEPTYVAAMVLTERMVKQAIVANNADDASWATVYVLETRREIRVEFNHIAESVDKLARAYEASFWANKVF